MGAPVLDARGAVLGHVKEFAVAPTVDAAHVQGMLVRLTTQARKIGGSKAQLTLVPIASMVLTATGAMQLREDASPVALAEDDNFLLLERDLLDQQIIDVHGSKVVRVNDVEMVWEFSADCGPNLSLRIAEVEVGVRGALRRLLKGLPQATVERLA